MNGLAQKLPQLRVIVALLILIGLNACATHPKQVREAAELVGLQQSRLLTCTAQDRCAAPSELMTRARDLQRENQSTQSSDHNAVLLDHAEDSLALRVHLIRAAQRSIDLQTFIFTNDDAGNLILQELLAAAARGVRVRVLADQLFSIGSTRLLAQLARTHSRFAFRVYNPTFGEAHTSSLEFAAGIVCCFKRFNQRMHNKLLLIDDLVGINGGRNIDDRYFDWNDQFNYRDRDVLLMGPATAQMAESFDIYWRHPQTVAAEALKDVSARIVADGPLAASFHAASFREPDRITRVRANANDPSFIEAHFTHHLHRVNRAEYFADLPNKPFEKHLDYDRDLTDQLTGLLSSAKVHVSLQTPYLVFSKAAQKLLRELHKSQPELRVEVSTNSLASTDAFYVYALSYKYKRRYLTKLNLNIYEYRPWPKAMRDSEQKEGAQAVSREQERRRLKNKLPVPLKDGRLIRRGMHAKSMVVDDAVAMIGTHNFDPRSVDLNTESGVVIWDRTFATALRASIESDMAPDESWVIARKQEVPWVGKINDTISDFSERLPVFDFWPFRYATSFELKKGCAPLAPDHPAFYQCYEPVGDFPEVDATLKHIYTRMVTAFGAGLTPIL